MPHFHALGIQDVFSESGKNDEVRDVLGVGVRSIVEAATLMHQGGQA
jgi:transketolase C-terminal domain/subunit